MESAGFTVDKKTSQHNMNNGIHRSTQNSESYSFFSLITATKHDTEKFMFGVAWWKHMRWLV